MKRKYLRAAILASTLLAGAAQAEGLRIALADDPDALDPVTNTTATGIAVMTAMCERLLYTDQELNVLPGLAESWEWSADGLTLTLKLAEGVKFQDGTPFDAAAVKVNLDRARAPGTQRHSDLLQVASVEAPDPLTVVITLTEPSAQVLGTLAERNGIYFSPAALEREGANIGRAPVCVGPYKFVSRVAQDHLLLEKDPSYRFADEYHFDTVTFRVIPADSVRLANLQAGDVDIIEKLDPALAATVEGDDSIRLVQNHSLNSQALMFNFAKEGPLQDIRVRRALELALDKQAINEVVFSGRYKAANQIAAPDSRFYDAESPIVQRDPAAAMALLQEAGLTPPVRIEVMIPNRPLSVRVGEMLQAMATEAGFDIKLNVVDFATSLQLAADGQFEAWGPIGGQFANDLDNVAMQVLHSTGGRNLGKYYSDELDALLEATRSATDLEARVAAFQAVSAHVATDLPVIYLYHQVPIFAQRADLDGMGMTGDGFLLLRGARIDG